MSRRTAVGATITTTRGLIGREDDLMRGRDIPIGRGSRGVVIWTTGRGKRREVCARFETTRGAVFFRSYDDGSWFAVPTGGTVLA